MNITKAGAPAPEYYELAAAYCAAAGFSDPMLVRALIYLPAETLADIEADPQAFKERVSDYAYGAAMEKIGGAA